MAVIKIGDIDSQLVADISTVKLVSQYLKYERDYFERANSGFTIPKYVYMIDKSGKFLSGLADDVVAILKHNDIEFKIEDNRLIKQCPPVEDIKIRLKEMPFTLRDYQMDALLGCLAVTRGIVHSCTGSGKTIIMSALIKAWWRPTLIAVKSKDLMYQLQAELAAYCDASVGIIGDGRYAPEFITVGLVQTLQNSRGGKKKNNKIQKYLDTVECLIVDEVHNAQSRSYRMLMRRMKNASLRYGFSATPETSKIRLEDGERGNRDIVLKAYFGPILFTLKTRDLIKRGYLAEPTVYIIQNEVYCDSVKLEYNEEYERIIMADEYRNHVIAALMAQAYADKKQVIGFVHRIDHGKEIAQILQDEFGISPDDIGYATGESVSQERKSLIKDFKEGALPILMGTILNEGLDFLTEVGINISGGDSNKTTIQRVGRILRKPRDPVLNDVDTKTKRFVKYYDFADNGHPYFGKHSQNRIETYQKEGHEIKFLDPHTIIGVDNP